MYCQVKVKRPTVYGTEEKVFWTEESKAIKDKTVKVQEDNGSWSEGWVVDEVYPHRVDESYVVTMRHAHTKQRKASDI